MATQLMVIDESSRRSVNRLFLIQGIPPSQYFYLHAMKDCLDHGGNSRDSVLHTDPRGDLPRPDSDLGLPEEFRLAQLRTNHGVPARHAEPTK